MNTTPRRVEYQQTDKGSIPVYTTGTVEQPWADYTRSEHEVWATLFRRQREILQGRACNEFIENQQRFGMSPDAIPKFQDLNRVLKAGTNWEIVGVEGLLPDDVFFDHLANRRFPVTWWIRKPEQLDYLSEPDLFHDLFGHVPMLLNPVFADYVQAYGRGGVKAHKLGAEALTLLTRLYWHTVEFGLINTPEGVRIYGSGIVSSRGESIFCLESDVPNRIGFDLERIMLTQYKIDTYQRNYFVIDSFQQLMDATKPDFTPIYARLAKLESIPAGELRPGDRVIHRGTGEGWSDTGTT
ncbi:MAG: phenylalanine 4-monooxygenase [Proteobacteria bacterium]|nr:phenylalanine 4-monooxygenase [Pseudomonadota bacterium]